MPRLLSSALLVLLCATASVASAQDRSRSHRARMELALDHGLGASTEGMYGELSADLRIFAPEGVGAVLRTGVATRGFSNAPAVDLGIAYRLDLFALDHVGLQLDGVIGPSVAYGPFDDGNVAAYGGWAMIHLDFWYRNMVVGLGVSAHAMLSERYGSPQGRDSAILTITPTIRIGGDWGL